MFSSLGVVASSHPRAAGLKVESSADAGGSTIPLTCPAMTNGLLLVLIGSVGSAPGSATWDSSALTLHGSYLTPSSLSRGACMLYITDPSPGSHDLVLGSSTAIRTVAVFLSGANQGTPLRTATGEGVDAGGTRTLTPVSDVGDIVFDAIGFRAGEGAATLGSGQTVLFNGYSASNNNAAMSYKAGEATSTTMEMTIDGLRSAYIAAAVVPA